LRANEPPLSSQKSHEYSSSRAGRSSLPVAVNRTRCGAGPDGLSTDATTVGASLASPGSVTVTSTTSEAVSPSSSVTVTVAVCAPGSVNVYEKRGPSTVPFSSSHL
jgi:hypothetical protein